MKNNRSLYLFLGGMLMAYSDAILIAYGKETTSIYKIILPVPQSFIDLLSDFAMLTSLFLLFFSVIFALYEKKYLNLRSKYRAWFFSVFIGFFLLLSYGFLLQNNDIRFVAKDIMAFSLLFGGILVGSEYKNWAKIDKFIVLLFFISIVLSLIGMKDLVRQVSSFEARIYITWSTPYILWGTMHIWPYFFITANSGTKKRRFVAYSGVILFFIMALIFQKRIPWVYLSAIIILVLSSLSQQRDHILTFRKLNKLLFCILAGGMIIYFAILTIGLSSLSLNQSLTSLLTRFEFDLVRSDSRLNLDIDLYKKYNKWEMIFGRGIGADVGDVADDPEYRIPHNGMIFMLIKGGVAFLPIWLFGWFLLLKDFFVTHNPSFNRYYIPVLIIFLFSWIGGFMHNVFHFGFHMMCAGLAMSRKVGLSNGSKICSGSPIKR